LGQQSQWQPLQFLLCTATCISNHAVFACGSQLPGQRARVRRPWISHPPPSSTRLSKLYRRCINHSSLRRSPSFFTNLRNSMTGQYFALHIYFVLFISHLMCIGFLFVDCYLSTVFLMCIRVLFVDTCSHVHQFGYLQLFLMDPLCRGEDTKPAKLPVIAG